VPNLFNVSLRLGPLSKEQAGRAIRDPIGRYNASNKAPVEDYETIAEPILHDLGDAVDPTILQIVMHELWERCQKKRKLLAKDYEAAGRVEGILDTHLKKRLKDANQEIAARVLPHLVTPTGAKIAHSVADLAAFTKTDADKLTEVMEQLAEGSKRVLRKVGKLPGHGESQCYEIYHDRLATGIMKWVKDYKDEQERTKVQKIFKDEEVRLSENERVLRHALERAERARDILLARDLVRQAEEQFGLGHDELSALLVLYAVAACSALSRETRILVYSIVHRHQIFGHLPDNRLGLNTVSVDSPDGLVRAEMNPSGEVAVFELESRKPIASYGGGAATLNIFCYPFPELTRWLRSLYPRQLTPMERERYLYGVDIKIDIPPSSEPLETASEEQIIAADDLLIETGDWELTNQYA
jgi:hypothetical protein